METTDSVIDNGSPTGAVQPTTTRLPFAFHGNANDFFRIWIVNLVLTICTLGIYGAWAKVRNNQYFYGNTELAGSRFQYLATPKQILIGRIIMLVVIGIYIGLQNYDPMLGLIATLVIMAITPWVLVRSLRFNARMSAWRGIRFNFTGTTLQAYGVFLLAGLLTMVTFGLGFPYALYMIHKYILGGHRFGKTDFIFKGDAGQYFIPYLIAMAISVGLYIVILAVAFGLAAATGSLNGGGGGDVAAGVITVVMVILVYIGFGLLGTYVNVAIANHAMSNTYIGKRGQIQSNLNFVELFKIYVGNIFGIVFSLGLLIPWAIIRTVQYKLEHMGVNASGNLDEFVADERAAISAIGDELGDAIDVDFGL